MPCRVSFSTIRFSPERRCRLFQIHSPVLNAARSLDTISVGSAVFKCTCENQDRVRLDTYLAAKIPSTTRSQICQSIKSGFVTINDTACTKPSYSIKAGDRVHFERHKRIPSTVTPEDLPLNVVYEDNDVLVINKDVGMVVHPSAGHWSGTLVNALMHHSNARPLPLSNPPRTLSNVEDPVDDVEQEPSELQDHQLPVFRPGIVHRLDIGTSGLLVVAKNDMAHCILSEGFKNREVARRYVSIMIGCPKEIHGQIKTNIGRHPKDRKLQKTFLFGSSTGRTAISNFRVLSPGELASIMKKSHLQSDSAMNAVLLSDREPLGWSLVSWQLETGRTHQIRVHAKHLGCPIMGDTAYGGDAKCFVSRFRSSKKAEELIRLSDDGFPHRPMLHAQSLEFTHPRTNERMSFSSPLPEDFVSCLTFLQSVDLPLM